MEEYKLKYFKELSRNFSNRQQVTAEIINLRAILNLPKATEHFVSDIHGEYEMFLHILKTASGVIKRKIDEEFGRSLTSDERAFLASLIYYSEEKLAITDKNDDWYRIILYRLIRVCKTVAAKYTRSKVRKLMPKNYSYVIDELLNCDSTSVSKGDYYNGIIDTIVELKQAESFVIAICNLIQSLATDHLHIVGDIFDRGPRADIILDYLQTCRSVDIQWGNHDILWIGAGIGDAGCILATLCDCFKYGNLEFLEDGYAINLLPLYSLVSKYYADDDCSAYRNSFNDDITAKLYKAVMIMRFKIEDSYRMAYPEFGMKDDTVLDKIDFDAMTWNGSEMLNMAFPTIDCNNPFELCKEEQEALDKLIHCYTNSDKLQKHLQFLMNKGSIYKIYNGSLLFHGCIPLEENGEFLNIEIDDSVYKGKNYLDYCDEVTRRAYKNRDKHDLAFMWQLWCGKMSPMFGKDKMATFERMCVVDKALHKEVKQFYFKHQDNEMVCNNILREFGLDIDNGQIINGHIPVKHAEGESPIKANGKMLVIDGGMSKPYQKVTGIAGFTLTYNSYGLSIASHEPFLGKENAIINNEDLLSVKNIVKKKAERIRVKDTDIGVNLIQQIEDLKVLLGLYNEGILAENAIANK